MAVTCAVENCKNKVKYKFPKNETIKKNWLHAIKRPDFQPRSMDGLCGDHFLPHDQLSKESSFGGIHNFSFNIFMFYLIFLNLKYSKENVYGLL